MPRGLLHDGLRRAADRHGSKAALVEGERIWSFAELDAATGVLSDHLGAGGVTPGSRVAVMSSNRAEFLVTVEAVSRLGAAAVLINPAWKRLELAHALEVSDPVHAVGDGACLDLLAAQMGPGAVSDLDDAAVWSGAHGGTGRGFESEAGAEVLLVFSSGTTGLPKAVRHTHRSMGHAVAHWIASLGLGAEDRFQIATPPSHILGLLNLVTAVEAGTTVRLHPRFDLDAVLASVEQDRMTLEMAVAPIALAMANHPDIERYDLSSLRYIMWGATPVTPSVALTVTARTGVRWLPAYGASEVPVIAANPVGDPAAWRLDSAGLPPEGVELRAVDLDSGEVLGAGETGEIQVRSLSAMTGYLPADATEGAFADGWYRTGDVGWLEPGGWVHLTDRSKEMIKVNGFQVAPAEIEAVLLGHPGVVDCAVFAVADERAGEVPVAAVRRGPGSSVTETQLMELVAGALASYKKLRHVVLVDAVPRLPSGKVLRRVLRREWEPRLAAGPGPAR